MTTTVSGITPNLATAATNQHYELPVEVFAAFLDSRMKYSSGLYIDGVTDLESAQLAKLGYVAARLGVGPGDRAIDIGCGWGSLMLFLAVERRCSVTGVTPSRTQAAYIEKLATRAGVRELIDVQVGSFSSLPISGRYDAATMLGSIVHMPDRAAVLRKARGLLRSGGSLYLSESCFRNDEVYDQFANRPGTRHVTESIFGFADLVPLSTLVRAVEDADLSIVRLDDLTGHYLRTTTEWEERARTNRARIEAAAPGMTDPLIRYLQTASAGWGYTTKHYALTMRRGRFSPAEIVP